MRACPPCTCPTAVPSFTGGAHPSLIYDYHGFPPETYALEYAAPGHPALARQAAQLLQQAGFAATVDADYGWDHGVFIPLKVMLPDANVPVVAMSLQAKLDPTLHCELGAALQSLRDEGVLYGNREERTRSLAVWNRAPGGPASHPREEHFLPLMVASGVGSDLPAWAFD